MKTLLILALALVNLGWLGALGYSSNWPPSPADVPIMGGLFLTFALDAGVFIALAV